MADLGDRGLHRSERGERGAAHTAELLRRHIWNIHVENDRALNAEQQSECLTRNSFRRRPVDRVRAGQGDRERLAVVGACRERGAHRAGVQDRVAGVGTAVDPGEDDVRRRTEGAAAGDERNETGRARDGIDIRTVDAFEVSAFDDDAAIGLLSSQGGAASAGFFARRRDDRAETGGERDERQTSKAFRRDAVVIGHQGGDGHVGRARTASGASPPCSTVTVNNGDGATTTTTHPI